MNDLYLLSAFVCCIFVLVNDTWRASSQKYLEATVQSHDQSRDNNSSTGIYDACRNVARLTRPESSSIAGFLAALIALRGGCASSVIVRVGISMTLTTMAGFVIDDVHDIFQDQIAGVSTVLTDRRMSVLTARMTAALLAAMALCISPGGAAPGMIILLTFAALVLYARFAQLFPRLKCLYTALLVCVPLYYGSLVAGIRVQWVYYAVVALFVCGRELYIDCQQADGDAKSGLRTLAVTWSRPRTQACGTIAMLTAVGLLTATASGTAARGVAILSLLATSLILGLPVFALRRTALMRIVMALLSVP